MQSYNSLHISLLMSALLVGLLCLPANLVAQDSFIALAYHDVVDTRDELESDGVTLETLVSHFEWLKAHDYHPVSIDLLVSASKGEILLPDKAVLLCWDDGYTSFYTHVFPLLKAYNYPAVLALVGDWMTTPENGTVQYGDELVSRNKFLSWKQVKELATSGLVEIGSHSMDLHRGLLADQAGDILPAAITHKYDSTGKSFETDQEMYERIYKDLKENNELIEQHSGVTPRVMVWPFGRYNQLSIKAAKKAGIEITLTLDPVPASSNLLDSAARYYPTLNPETGSFKNILTTRTNPPLRRFIKVKTEDFIEQDLETESRFSEFLERTKSLMPGRVLITPTFTHEKTTYSLFNNNRFPTKQDRLIRLTWHTNRRGSTETHLWLDDFLFNKADNESASDLTSFFHDMGKAAPCSGLIINSPEFAIALLKNLNGSQIENLTPIPSWNPNSSRSNRQHYFSSTKVEVGKNIFNNIESFQYWQPFLDMGLVVPIDVLINSDIDAISNLLRLFDYLALDLRQTDKISTHLRQWLDQDDIQPIKPYLIAITSHTSHQKSSILVDKITELQSQGLNNFGYDSDDFLNKSPLLQAIKPKISTQTYPFISK